MIRGCGRGADLLNSTRVSLSGKASQVATVGSNQHSELGIQQDSFLPRPSLG